VNDVAGNICLRERFYESLARRAARIDAQPYRRLDVVRCKDFIDIVRIVAGDRIDEPRRMRGARHDVGVQSRQMGFAFAQPSAQQCVGERGEFRFSHCARRVDRGGDSGVIGKLQDFQLHESEHEQRLNIGIAQRMCDECVDRRREAQPPSRTFVEQRGQKRAIARIGNFFRCRRERNASRLSGNDSCQCLRGDRAQIGAGIHGARTTSRRAFR
jgi:hypothetical protein